MREAENQPVSVLTIWSTGAVIQERTSQSLSYSWSKKYPFACIRDRHPRRHARSHKQTLAKFSTRPLSNCSKALPHCYSSPAYLFSLAACFHFLNEHLSFLSILSLFCFTENQSVYVRAYFCLCCVSAFWQPERGPSREQISRYWETTSESYFLAFACCCWTLC